MSSQRSTSGTKTRSICPASRSTRRSPRRPTPRRPSTDADAALLVVPAQFLRGVLGALRRIVPPAAAAAALRQGDRDRLARDDVADRRRDRCPASPFAVLSGPSFAAEVARGLPTAVTIASRDAGARRAVHGGARQQPVPSLSVAGPDRRRNRRRGQERAGDRLRDRRRARPRRQCARRADHPRARRDGAARARQGRAMPRPFAGSRGSAIWC